jgi:hypothetical protein
LGWRIIKSASKRSETLADADPAFDGSVIPFQDVIEILRRSMSTVLSRGLDLVQSLNLGRFGWQLAPLLLGARICAPTLF